MRINFMLSKVSTKHRMSVIDIGCGVDGRSFEDYIPANWHVTGVDIQPEECIHHTFQNFCYIRQDARDLSRFGDNEYDLAVSIGMLEHVVEKDAFRGIVSEIRRVAKQYIICVPYKYCWIEPHYGVPFFPILPDSAKAFLVKALNLSGHRDVLREEPDYILKNYQWLSNAEYRQHFPEATVYLTPTLETIAIIKKSRLPDLPQSV